jgi:hypothetical protein
MRATGESQEQGKGVIKHRKTEEYYKGEGQWTPDVQQAMEFQSLSRVVEEAHRYGIKDCCEFIMRLAKLPGFIVLLPL